MRQFSPERPGIEEEPTAPSSSSSSASSSWGMRGSHVFLYITFFKNIYDMHGIAIQPPYNTLWKRAVRQTPVRSFTFRCQSLTKMKSLCRGHCICLSISIWTVATQITFSSRTSQGRFKWTNSLWSTGAPRSKTHSTMIFKKFSRIFSFLWMTARTGCWKGSKVRSFARFGDKTLRARTQKIV